MKKTLLAAAIAASMWGGAALADDYSSTSTYPTTNSNDTNTTSTQSQDKFQSDQGLGGSGDMAEPQTNVNVDVQQPAPQAAVTPMKSDQKNKESKADMRGLTVLLGGGVEGYSGALAPKIAPGPAWDVTAALKPSKVFGLELGYTGAANELRGSDANNGADIVRNGGQAVATVGLTAAPVQPYILGGVGVSRYNVRNGGAGLRDDTVGSVPAGVGLRTHIGNFTADARGTYNWLFDNQFGGRPGGTNAVGFNNMDTGRYLGSLNIGSTF
ncbi:MAG: hypothetical protein ACJ790_00030 [Myxococcaceae bacterium]